MGLYDTITDSNTQKEHGIEQEIELFAKLGWTIELKHRRKINS